jgi:F-type H+-transporting ATPase subunit b
MIMVVNLIYAVLAVEGESGNLLDVNPGLIFWTVITFIILLLILKKLAWKPILTALDQRENSIKDALEKAEKARLDSLQALEENKASIAKAEEESRKIIDQSRTYAETLKSQMLDQSKLQAKKIVDDAAVEIQRKQDAAFNELKGQIAEIAITAAEKILNEKLDKEAQQKIIDRYISDIRKN